MAGISATGISRIINGGDLGHGNITGRHSINKKYRSIALFLIVRKFRPPLLNMEGFGRYTIEMGAT